MMSVCAFVALANLYMPEVEQTWSASFTTSGLHSGWQTNRAPGFSSLAFKTSSGLSLSCVGHQPSHHSIFFFVWRET